MSVASSHTTVYLKRLRLCGCVVDVDAVLDGVGDGVALENFPPTRSWSTTSFFFGCAGPSPGKPSVLSNSRPVYEANAGLCVLCSLGLKAEIKRFRERMRGGATHDGMP